MFKKKEINVSNELTEMIENMNFDAPNEKIEEIDAKLNILLNNLEYNEYINFIQSDKKLKTYDDILGKYANNELISKLLVKGLNNKMYEYINKLVNDKIKELNLQ